MKKIKLLPTLLTLTALGTSVAIITSCSNLKTSDKEVVEINDTDVDVTPNASTTHIKFRLTPEQLERPNEVKIFGGVDLKVKQDRLFASIPKPTATSNGYPVTYWVDENGNRVKDNYKIPAATSGLTFYPYFETDVDLGKCVGIAAIQDSRVSLIDHDGNLPNVSYSLDGDPWETYPRGKPIEVPAGSVLYFKGNNNVSTNAPGFSHSETQYTSFSISGSVNLNGNVMTLLDDGVGSDNTKMLNDYCFFRLFEHCSGIVSISSNFLPAKQLTNHCYSYMFSDCSCLTDFPSTLFSATDFDQGGIYTGEYCYAGMFMNCPGIQTVSTQLLDDVTDLSKYCYYQMFAGCEGLEELGAGTLLTPVMKEGCYSEMFADCTNLNKISADLLYWSDTAGIQLAPSCYAGMFQNTALDDLSGFRLGVTNLSNCDSCYADMFWNCDELTKAPALPASTLSNACYEEMFYNCTALIQAPALNANTLTTECYCRMFYNCTSLETPPTLPATTLASYCYCSMFSNSGITTLPTLSVRTLQPYCYQAMFSGCAGITDASDVFPTDGSVTLASHCCEQMFLGSGITAAPTLRAQTAVEFCYSQMYQSCNNLVSTGTIRINSTANHCCYYMFKFCSEFYVQRTSQTSSAFITIPSWSESSFAFTNMFVGTWGENPPVDPAGGTSWAFSSH